MSPQTQVRCRPIGPADLEKVAALLVRGFPARPPRYWTRGLGLLAARTVPDGFPRFGFLLEHEGQPVGVILVIAQEITHDGPPFVRCNLASWYVEPAYRSHAALLTRISMRIKTATYVNISAAPNTWPTVEAQGLKRYTFGQRLALPLLQRGAPGLRVDLFRPGQHDDLPDAALLADHAEFGCLSLVGHGGGGPVPFVFAPVRLRQGRYGFPGVQLVFCRATEDLRRFAAPLGRALLMRGTPFLLFDDQASATLPGLMLKRRARKYYRGSHPPRLGDLAYTEFTIFGP